MSERGYSQKRQRTSEGSGEPLWWHVSETAWYETTLQHWKTAVPADTADGVLGGYSAIDDLDTAWSREFLGAWRGSSVVTPGSRALDCGAGIGRVTEGVLLHAFESVHLVEVSPPLIAQARQKLADHGERIRFTAASLRDFEPEPAHYDVVWMQWILGHLTDTDMVRLLHSCVGALRTGGAIFVKENNAVPSACKVGRGRYALDVENGAVVRSHAHHLSLFRKAGLRVVRFKRQENFPEELHAVRIYELVPIA